MDCPSIPQFCLNFLQPEFYHTVDCLPPQVVSPPLPPDPPRLSAVALFGPPAPQEVSLLYFHMRARTSMKQHPHNHLCAYCIK